MTLLRLHARSVFIVLLTSAGILAWHVSARAQDAYPPVPPAYISFVDGDALMSHEGAFEPAVINTPIVEGDRIRTRTGRVQVVFPDGSAIDISRQSDVVFLTDTRVSVLSGSIERHTAETIDGTYAAYLPQELQMYGRTFSRYGSWQNEGPYGRVWYPRVANAWRPYSEGHWTPLRSYGWTWVGVDAWSWPTHHYGRWGYARGSWFWIPARAWAPAWVSWAAAPGYVTWCPLGINGSPVFALSIGYGDPWTGWTVVHRDTFGDRRSNAHPAFVDTHHLTRATPFILQSREPVTMPIPGTVPLPVIRNATPAVTPPPVLSTRPVVVAPPAAGGVIVINPSPANPSPTNPPPAQAMERVLPPAHTAEHWRSATPPAAYAMPHASPRYRAPDTEPLPDRAVRSRTWVAPSPSSFPPAPIPVAPRQPRAPAPPERASALERTPAPSRGPGSHTRIASPRDAAVPAAPAAPAAVPQTAPPIDHGRPPGGGVVVKRPG
jgi:hypothetical protein